MASRGKKLIPTGLLRRSARSKSTLAIKSEIDENDIVKQQSQNKCVKGCNLIENSSAFPTKTMTPNVDGFIEVDEQELNLERTLLGGQSFRWTKVTDERNYDVFTGVVDKHALQIWRCDHQRIAFKKLNKEGTQDTDELRVFLEDYFQLRYKLKDLYLQWSKRDDNLSKCCKQYSGFRILRQDPVENIFSFICATCNNIKRISQMIDKMCQRFGDELERKSDKQSGTNDLSSESLRTFPQVQRLIEDDVFECLRYELGFGYRAKFIIETARQLMELTKSNQLKEPRDYLLTLRRLPYPETCKQLQKFPGIGRKVADCVCLMSMDHLNAIPVDCHIYEIFCRNYMPKLRDERKSLTETVHDMIGAYFNQLHGPLSGWSTSVLFIAELKHLKSSNNIDQLLEKNWARKNKSEVKVAKLKKRKT